MNLIDSLFDEGRNNAWHVYIGNQYSTNIYTLDKRFDSLGISDNGVRQRITNVFMEVGEAFSEAKMTADDVIINLYVFNGELTFGVSFNKEKEDSVHKVITSVFPLLGRKVGFGEPPDSGMDKIEYYPFSNRTRRGSGKKKAVSSLFDECYALLEAGSYTSWFRGVWQANPTISFMDDKSTSVMINVFRRGWGAAQRFGIDTKEVRAGAVPSDESVSHVLVGNSEYSRAKGYIFFMAVPTDNSGNARAWATAMHSHKTPAKNIAGRNAVVKAMGFNGTMTIVYWDTGDLGKPSSKKPGKKKAVSSLFDEGWLDPMLEGYDKRKFKMEFMRNYRKELSEVPSKYLSFIEQYLEEGLIRARKHGAMWRDIYSGITNKDDVSKHEHIPHTVQKESEGHILFMGVALEIGKAPASLWGMEMSKIMGPGKRWGSYTHEVRGYGILYVYVDIPVDGVVSTNKPGKRKAVSSLFDEQFLFENTQSKWFRNVKDAIEDKMQVIDAPKDQLYAIGKFLIKANNLAILKGFGSFEVLAGVQNPIDGTAFQNPELVPTNILKKVDGFVLYIGVPDDGSNKSSEWVKSMAQLGGPKFVDVKSLRLGGGGRKDIHMIYFDTSDFSGPRKKKAVSSLFDEKRVGSFSGKYAKYLKRTSIIPMVDYVSQVSRYSPEKFEIGLEYVRKVIDSLPSKDKTFADDDAFMWQIIGKGSHGAPAESDVAIVVDLNDKSAQNIVKAAIIKAGGDIVKQREHKWGMQDRRDHWVFMIDIDSQTTKAPSGKKKAVSSLFDEKTTAVKIEGEVGGPGRPGDKWSDYVQREDGLDYVMNIMDIPDSDRGFYKNIVKRTCNLLLKNRFPMFPLSEVFILDETDRKYLWKEVQDTGAIVLGVTVPRTRFQEASIIISKESKNLRTGKSYATVKDNTQGIDQKVMHFHIDVDNAGVKRNKAVSSLFDEKDGGYDGA